MPLDNANQPAEPSLSEADRADMEVFLGHMLGMLPVLGVHAFEQAPKASAAEAGRCSPAKAKACRPQAMKGQPGLCGARGFAGRGRNRAQHGAACARHTFDLRQELISNGVLAMQGGLYHFTQDYSFSSPSGGGRHPGGVAPTAGWMEDGGRAHAEGNSGGGAGSSRFSLL